MGRKNVCRRFYGVLRRPRKDDFGGLAPPDPTTHEPRTDAICACQTAGDVSRITPSRWAESHSGIGPRIGFHSTVVIISVASQGTGNFLNSDFAVSKEKTEGEKISNNSLQKYGKF
jgi:hypothetical protein